jgi:hypothetical protein
MTMTEEKKTCALCGKTIVGFGHNAAPLAEGQCCDDCNRDKVIPQRIRDMGLREPRSS